MEQAIIQFPFSEGGEQGNPLLCPIVLRNKNVQGSIMSNLVAISFRGHFPGEAYSHLHSCYFPPPQEGWRGLALSSFHLPLLQ